MAKTTKATTNGNNDKAAKFVTLATKRMNKVVTDIRSLRKLANTNSYQYNKAQVDKMLATLTNEVKALAHDFEAGKVSGGDGFNFD